MTGAVVAAVLVLGTACGSGDPDGPGGSGEVGTAERAQEAVDRAVTDVVPGLVDRGSLPSGSGSARFVDCDEGGTRYTARGALLGYAFAGDAEVADQTAAVVDVLEGAGFTVEGPVAGGGGDETVTGTRDDVALTVSGPNGRPEQGALPVAGRTLTVQGPCLDYAGDAAALVDDADPQEYPGVFPG